MYAFERRDEGEGRKKVGDLDPCSKTKKCPVAT
jgi:hypothetical protein